MKYKGITSDHVQHGDEEKENNRSVRLFQLLLTGLGAAGMTGAYLTMLMPEFRLTEYSAAVAVCCVLMTAIWGREKRTGRKGLKVIIALLCLAGYAGIIFWQRELIVGGLINSVQNLIEPINERYQVQLVLPLRENIGEWEVTIALFLVSIPLLILLEYGLLRLRCWLVALLYLLPLIASCFVQVFPSAFSIICLIYSFCAVLAWKSMGGKKKLGSKAMVGELFVCVVSFTGAFMLLQPLLDKLYEATTDARHVFYVALNEEFLPGLSDIGWQTWFRSGTVQGDLDREIGFFYTGAELFEVTVEERPEQAVYLKGFVGNIYNGKEWEADGDQRLESYYRQQGWELPGDYTKLASQGFYAVEAVLNQAMPEQELLSTNGKLYEPLRMEVKELGGFNHYSLYPYGALLEDGKGLHADGTLEKQGKMHQYEYYPVWLYDGSSLAGLTSEEAVQAEKRYQQYAYDTYLEVPEGRITKLAESLKGDGLERKWQIVQAVIEYLDSQVSYNINAAPCPRGEDFVENFLFEQKEGYCAHYASAAVLLLRSFGIPARYVTGYCAPPGDFLKNEEGDYTAVIEDRQAHAWAEIYLDGVGWVPIETTPDNALVSLLRGSHQQVIANVAQMTGDITYDLWETDTQKSENQASPKKQEQTTTVPEQPTAPTKEQPEKDVDRSKLTYIAPKEKLEALARQKFLYRTAVIAVTLILLTVAILLSYKVRLVHQTRQLQKDTTNEAIKRLYRLLRKALATTNCPLSLQADSPELTSKVLILCPNLEQAEWKAFIEAVYQSSFGQREASIQQLQQAQTLYNNICQQLYHNLPVLHKFYFRYLRAFW